MDETAKCLNLAVITNDFDIWVFNRALHYESLKTRLVSLHVAGNLKHAGRIEE